MSYLDVTAASSIAAALADNAGVRLVTKKDSDELPRVVGNQITMGLPTVGTYEQFMQDLHTCIGQLAKDNKFFSSIPSRDKREENHKDMIASLCCEKWKHGTYAGRDRQLAAGYKRKVPFIQGKLEELAALDRTSAALAIVSNEVRNEWQGYSKLDVPESIREYAEKMVKELKGPLLSLEGEEDLQFILNKIRELEEEDDKRDSSGSGEPDDSGEGEEGAGGTGSGSPKPSDPSDPGDEQQGSEGPGDDESSSGDNEDSGEQQPSEGPDGEHGDEREGDPSGQGDPSSEGGTGGDSGGEADDDGQGGEAGEEGGQAGEAGEEGGSPSIPGEDSGDSSPSGDSGGQDGAADQGGTGEQDESAGEGEPKAASRGKGDSRDLLSSLGLVPGSSAVEQPWRIEDAPEDYPYIPGAPHVNEQLSRVPEAEQYRHEDRPLSSYILEVLGSFNLSRRVTKHLQVLSQNRWQYGKSKGALAPNKIAKMYSYEGPGQPPIFKQKECTKVETDVAFTILVDASGSMQDGPSYYDATTWKYTIAAASCIAISELLQSMRITHEIIIFTTDMGYREKTVDNTIIKSFDEVFVSRDNLAARLSKSDRVFGANADGESVKWAFSRLAQRKEREKLMLVLSDGSPAFSGNQGNDRQYLKDVVSLIEAMPRTDIMGIGIQDSNVQQYYTRNRVLQNLEELEPLFVELIKEKIVK